MLGINLKVGVEATLQRLNAHSKGRQLKDLKFVWGYHTAAIVEGCKGEITVFLPHVDEAKAVPDALLHRLVGYVCHELGHHWFTNSPAWHVAAGNDKFLHGLINGLEDPRIEQAVIKSGFAGNSRNLFVGLVNHVVGPELPTDYDNIPFILAVEGRRLNGYDILAKQTYQSTPWAADLEWALTEAHVAPDTVRITEIAIELAKRLKGREDEKPNGDPGEGEGEGPEGQPGEPGEGEGEGEGQDGEPGEGEGEGEGEGGEPGEDGKKGKGKGKGRSSDPTHWIEDELGKHQSEAQKDDQVSRIVEPTFYNFR